MFVDSLKGAMATTTDLDDYIENGVLHCGKCHTPKQSLLSIPILTGTDELRPFPILCKCEKEREAKKEQKKREADFAIRIKRLWGESPHDPELMRWKFEDDDGGQGQCVDVARKYCEKWQEMLANNMGILLFGNVGTGKTFIASCICNELLKQCVPVCATSFARIMNTLQSTYEKQDVLDKLGRFSMLMLDDLGAERDTSFAAEQIFQVVNARYQNKKPIIVTTNLSLKEIENPQNLAYTRIFDRVLEMCPIRLSVTGESRRRGLAQNRTELARELLLRAAGVVS